MVASNKPSQAIRHIWEDRIGEMTLKNPTHVEDTADRV